MEQFDDELCESCSMKNKYTNVCHVNYFCRSPKSDINTFNASKFTRDNEQIVPYLCLATDQNNEVARVSFLQNKMKNSTKWLILNFITIIVLLSERLTLPVIIVNLFAAICFLNICHYIICLVRTYNALFYVKTDSPISNKGQCASWGYTDLVRSFETTSAESLKWYWIYFDHLVATLKKARASPIGRMLIPVGLEYDLKTARDILMARSQMEENCKRNYVDSKYQMTEFMVKCSKKALYSQGQLDAYWDKYWEAAENETIRTSTPNITSLMNWTNESTCNVSPILSQLKYQVSSDPADCRRLLSIHDENPSMLPRWIANLKRWFSTKIKEVVEQFDLANLNLKDLGISNIQIGVSNVNCLQMVFNHLPELETYIPLLAFLTLTDNQAYLLWRYQVLASNFHISYLWNAGGDARGNWHSELGPTDSEIILHFFCTYLDMKLPDRPSHPCSKRPFSDVYFIPQFFGKTLRSYVPLAIIRQWVSPPHYNVVVDGKICDIPSGTNNAFQAILYFIYCIKIYKNSSIGRVHLGQHGLNVLWTIEQ